MRKELKLALALICATAIPAAAQQQELQRTISVTGTVENKTAPDQIIWSISLNDTDVGMRKAKEKSDDRVKAVIALRDKLGVKEGDLETGPVYIRRIYNEDERGRRTDFKHFSVSRSVTIRQRDLKRFDEFLDSLVASTEMEVSFRYDSSKLHEVRAETRLEALKIAKKKAEDMCETLGAKLGKVMVINEHPQDGSSSRFTQVQNNAVFFPSDPGADVATERFVPGAIDVKVTVYVSFGIE